MTREHFKEPLHVARLWVHECERVLSDRLVNSADLARFAEFRANATKKHFDDIKQARLSFTAAITGHVSDGAALICWWKPE